MAVCLAPVDVEGVQYLAVTTTPADLTTCAYVVTSGAEFQLLQGVAQQAAAPYDVANGGVIFGLMFSATLGLYLIVRSKTEILRIVRRGVANLV
jgi:hypothetical protein